MCVQFVFEIKKRRKKYLWRKNSVCDGRILDLIIGKRIRVRRVRETLKRESVAMRSSEKD